MESEALTALLNAYLTRMAEIALRHGGTVDKFIGDAVMVFYGDPDSRGEKEDAIACVEMAIEMRETMAVMRRQWLDRGIVKPLHIRMGINTGFCTVGNFGSEDRLGYTIVGGQVNVASRLESAASPDQILISASTHALVDEAIACQEAGPLEVKGGETPVHTWLVLDRRERVAARAERVNTALEGFQLRLDPELLAGADRSRVVAALQQALSRLEPPP